MARHSQSVPPVKDLSVWFAGTERYCAATHHSLEGRLYRRASRISGAAYGGLLLYNALSLYIVGVVCDYSELQLDRTASVGPKSDYIYFISHHTMLSLSPHLY